MYTCQKADEYIEKNRVDRADKPEFHLTTPVGWLNDPNGFSIYKGKVHLFYQFHPYSTEWGPMHWGHSSSKDFIKWEELPTALAPDSEFDSFGCFSGTAIENDGKHVLFYTGVVEEKLADGTKNVIQNQCMAVGDGISYEKISSNPVVDGKIMPEECSRADFRDPKVWKDADGRYYMLAGNRTYDGIPQVVLFSSDDMYNWKFESVFAKDETGRFGAVWECPDYFETEGRKILSTSVQGLEGGVWDARNVYQSGYFLVEGDILSEYVLSDYELWDYGFDYYAPQSFLAPDGRRIMVGWANEWEWMPSWKDWGPTYKEGWCGSFNIPMEVRLMKDSTLQFLPIKEIESLRQGGQFWDNLVVTEDELELKAGDGVTFELKMKIDLEKTDADKLEFTLRCGEDKKTVCMFDFKKAEMTVNRNNADGWSRGISRSVMYLNNKKELDVHILSDQSSLEIFTSEYQNNHSNNIFAGNFQNQLKVRAYGGSVAIKDIETYGLKDCYC